LRLFLHNKNFGTIERKVEIGVNILRSIFKRIINKIAFIAPGGGSIRPWLQKIRGVHIGNNVWIGQYVYVDEQFPEKVSIGDNCTIGLRVSIFSHFFWGDKRDSGYSGPVTIGKDVYIGPHCVLLPNVHIDEGSVIKAGTVVSRNVPAHTYWGTDSAGPLGEVTVPLTSEHTFIEFSYGLRPIHNHKGSKEIPRSD
jgi:acetyltransferase-like isoleucine patch superfamily enzyme